MKSLTLPKINIRMTTATGLNVDLASEVLRIKNNLIMYPDERQKKTRHLTVKEGETPVDKPKTVTEWLNNVIIKREVSEPLRWIMPAVKDEVTPIREKLTAEHKALLKSLSYKPRISNHMASLAA